jgi:hypothetical protein
MVYICRMETSSSGDYALSSFDSRSSASPARSPVEVLSRSPSPPHLKPESRGHGVISEFLTRNQIHIQALTDGLAPGNPRSIPKPGAAVHVDPYFLGALETIASETAATSSHLSIESQTDVLEARVAWLRAQEDDCAAGVESAGIADDIREMMAHGIITARLTAEKAEDRRERLGMRSECGRIEDPPEIAREPFIETVAAMCERYADRLIDLEVLAAIFDGLPE